MNETNTIELNSNKNVVDNYLKKHKLDLTLLPNKKMIKLSDLTSSSSASNNSTMTSLLLLNSTNLTNASPNITQPNSINNLKENNNPEELNKNDLEYYDEEEDDDEYDEEEEDDFDDEDDEECDDLDENELFQAIKNEHKNELALSSNISSSETEQDYSNNQTSTLMNQALNDKKDESSKKARKKREPSLKLKQKLSNDDLEKIVSCVKNRQAMVYTADVKKDNYVDKILKVKLIESNNDVKLSNGKLEALLKKSMFPKELNSLFDTFVSALCTQDTLDDENGLAKPILKCLVVDCGFKSFSEAEIIRHIKRHLAQDGYTCSVCSHQFASMTNLQRHLKIHSGDVGKEIKCIHCDYRASTITHVKRHMAHKHLERSLPCPHCSFMGATNAELKIHMARKHLELTGKNPLFLPKYLRKDYQCNVCKLRYNDFKEYQTHMYEHTSTSNRFQCTECPYNCKNFSKLKRHMLYHTGARNFECKICGNKFFQMEHLKRHMQSIHNVLANQTSSSTKKCSSKKNSVKLVESSAHLTATDNNNSLMQAESPQSPRDNLEQPVQECYKVTSKCIYKCQQCEFSTVKLFTLNDHVINKHYQNKDEARAQNGNETVNEMEDDDDENEEEYLDEIEEEEDEIEDANKFSYTCAFCIYKTNKKTNLKIHLQNNHSSQMTAPILLSNDSVIVNPNTKFQCGSCRSFLDNVNDFIRHMNDKHKIQVYIMESNGEMPNAQNQAQLNEMNERNETISESVPPATPLQPAEIDPTTVVTNSVVINENLVHQMTPLPKTSSPKVNYSQNHHQQIRNFINTSSYLSRQLNNSNSNTTVRINPLLLKRHGLLQNQTNLQKQATNVHMNEQHMNSYQEQAQPQIIYNQNSYDEVRNNVQIEYPNRYFSMSDLNEASIVDVAQNQNQLVHQTNNYQN